MADTDVGWLHAEAIRDLLDALPYPVHVGEVTADTDGQAPHTPAYPYLVVWPPPATRPTVTLNGYGGEATTTTQVTAAGLTAREAITALDRASAALHRKQPTIPGRRCTPITHVAGAGDGQPEQDNQAPVGGRPVYVTFAQFTLHSSPRSPDG